MSVSGGIVVGVVFASLFLFSVVITLVWCAYNIVRFGTPRGRRRIADAETDAVRREARVSRQRAGGAQAFEMQSPTTPTQATLNP
ncbi:hypothetical protein CALCODRAFT_504808 [Calocera cornea HHB12733]|uniref:Uncharacterized protein n=1 Tax=Calocera cornea HHB12733 TaxID=1353952 RepID=A0A165C7E1_9BASI|nr:hypothetical protein CALCODRAFT_504808 [Calocera cornea HHB12733]